RCEATPRKVKPTAVIGGVLRGGGLPDICRDRLHLFDRPAGRTVRDIRAREVECAPPVIAAAGVELRGVGGEGGRVSAQKSFEPPMRGAELRVGFSESPLRDQHVGKTPLHLWISARKRWQKQRLRLAGLVLARIKLRQVHARLYVARQISN